MAAECGLEYDHPKHLDQADGVIFKCDGDATKRPNYDKPIAKPTGH